MEAQSVPSRLSPGKGESVQKLQVLLYDTTLRDGAQGEGISFSLDDKLKITALLDRLGVHYVEGGWPGSNPKDAEYFRQVQELDLEQVRIAAFGSTCRVGSRPEEDANIQALLAAETPVVTVVGKSWALHVHDVLRTTLDENLRIICDSLVYLKAHGREVIYDAEHFFDGYKADPDYALDTLRSAVEGEADTLVLCDTSGGSLPWEIEGIVQEVRSALPGIPLGMHAHDDSGLAVANSLAAVHAGATHVQGTMNGYGERCGNANLCALIPNLELKMGMAALPAGQLAHLTRAAHTVASIANQLLHRQAAYVGRSAFAHKGGIHVAAMRRNLRSYQHIDPALVGNQSRVLVSELSGRGNLLSKAEEIGLGHQEAEDLSGVLQIIKRLEHQGFTFEGADASVEMLLHRSRRGYRPPFQMLDFMVVVEHREGRGLFAEATIKVRVGDQVFHTVAEGKRPGRGPAQGAVTDVSAPGPVRPGRLQGAYSGWRPRNGGHHPRADRHAERNSPVEHRGGLDQHHRGQLDGPGGRGGARPYHGPTVAACPEDSRACWGCCRSSLNGIRGGHVEARIVTLPGDGIGPEVVAQGVGVLQAVADRYGHSFTFQEALIGGCAIETAGSPLPEATLEACRRADGVLLGAVGDPRWSDPTAPVRPEQGLLGLRQGLGLYANLRPVRVYSVLLDASPLRPERLAGVDLVVVRELTGGIYFGPRQEATASDSTAYDTMVYTADEVRRIARTGFRLAGQRRGKVTSVDKANVLAVSRLWRRVVAEVAAEYPDVTLENLLVDAAAMHLLRRPADFDVVLTANMFGDILTDEASMLAGSMGMLPSASLGEGRRGVYEPIHGSAPDIAGQGVANPLATILSVAMLLRHSLGLEQEAQAVEAAVERVLEQGYRTPDIAGPDAVTVGTQRMGDLVAAALSSGE